MPDTSEDPNSGPVMGGSLTAAPNGELYTMLTPKGSWTPMTAQQVWSAIRTKRRKDWDGYEPRSDMYVVWWRGPVRLECGNCGSHIVDVETYRMNREYGLVWDTSRPHGEGSQRRPGQPFWRDGWVGGRAGRASVNFSCPGKECRHRKFVRRNLRRFGKELYEANPPTYTLQ